MRRVWAPKGERPRAVHRRAYKWVHVFHFVRPSTGVGHWLIMPTVNVEVMNLALESWMREVDPEGKKIYLLLVDGAGWHTSPNLIIPCNVRLHPLPSYTPELQPVESTWPLLRECVANRLFKRIDAMTRKLIARCRHLIDHPNEVKARTAWNWILQAESKAYSG